MPWFILKEHIDTRPIDGTQRRRALCAPDEQMALESVTVQGVKAEPSDVKACSGLHAMKYAFGERAFEECR